MQAKQTANGSQVTMRTTVASAIPWWISLFPIIFVTILITLKLIDNSTYWMVVQEDGMIEYLTAFSYLLGALATGSIAASMLRSGRHDMGILYILLTAGFVLIGMEEISWGQRIFSVSSPEFFEANNGQQEINLHNFAGRHLLHLSFIVISAVGAFAWLVPSRFVPARFRSRLWMLAPAPGLMGYFLPAMLYYTYIDYIAPVLVHFFGPVFLMGWNEGDPYFVNIKDQEPLELVLGLGMMLFAAFVFLRLRRERPSM